jgi:hypothetical protein
MHSLLSSLLLALVLAGAGCTKVYETEIIRLPCGQGELVIHERCEVEMVSRVNFELRLIDGHRQRRVDGSQSELTLYRLPTAAEGYRVLRTSPPEGFARSRFSDVRLWAVYVNPRVFSPEEYDQLAQTLSEHLPAIDTALGRPRQPSLQAGSGRQPWIVSIRYVDYEALRHVYTGPAPLRIEVDPGGEVIRVKPSGTGGTQTGGIGWVVDDGGRILLAPALAEGEDMADLRRCVDARGRTLHDDFVVDVAEADMWGEVGARVRDREATFHHLKEDYVKSFRHSSRPVSLHLIRRGMAVVAGAGEHGAFVRDFGYLVDGTTLLLPPAEATQPSLPVLIPIPGIAERTAFAAQCRDDEGRPLSDRYRVESASDMPEYLEKVKRAYHGPK